MKQFTLSLPFNPNSFENCERLLSIIRDADSLMATLTLDICESSIFAAISLRTIGRSPHFSFHKAVRSSS
ncbi:MAG: hypothetical protein QXX88_02120, partial [Metallosphaera sp.]